MIYYIIHDIRRDCKPENYCFLNAKCTGTKQNNCTLILLKIPDIQDWNDDKHNTIKAYAEVNNLAFIDLNYDNTNFSIDWSTDSSDSGYHLNIHGAQKVSKYLADYLKENFELESHKDDPNYSSWSTAYENYCNNISSK